MPKLPTPRQSPQFRRLPLDRVTRDPWKSTVRSPKSRSGKLAGLLPITVPASVDQTTALVGTSETVAQALLEYYKLGATSLLIRGYDPRPDAVQYGEELIPRLRELAADFDAASGTDARPQPALATSNLIDRRQIPGDG